MHEDSGKAVDSHTDWEIQDEFERRFTLSALYSSDAISDGGTGGLLFSGADSISPHSEREFRGEVGAANS